MSDGKPAKRALAGLLIVLALGTALRFNRISAESLWLDEAVSLQIAQESLGDIVHDTTEDVHPPLYYFALHYWMRAFGESELGMRSLSAIFGVLLLWAVCRLSARLFDAPTGLVAALFVGVSAFHLGLAQEARMYALLTLTSVLSMDGFARLTSLESVSRWTFAGYVAATTAMLYTQNYGWFIVVAQVLYVIVLGIASRRTYLMVWRRALLALAGVALLYLPWLERLLEQVLRVQQGFWIQPNPPLSLLKTFVEYAGSPALAWVLIPLGFLPLVRGRERRHAALLVVWIACLVPLPFLVSLVSSPIFMPKYTIAGSIAVLMLAARGVTMIPRRAIQALIVVVIAGLAIAPLDAYYGSSKKQRWRDLVADIDRQAQAGDLVLFNQPYLQLPFDYYTKGPRLVEVPFQEFRDGLTARSIHILASVAVAGHDRVWLVVTTTDPLTPIIKEELLAQYRVAAHAEDRGVEVYRLERKNSG